MAVDRRKGAGYKRRIIWHDLQVRFVGFAAAKI
jgi:hypothetical protein